MSFPNIFESLSTILSSRNLDSTKVARTLVAESWAGFLHRTEASAARCSGYFRAHLEPSWGSCRDYHQKCKLRGIKRRREAFLGPIYDKTHDGEVKNASRQLYLVPQVVPAAAVAYVDLAAAYARAVGAAVVVMVAAVAAAAGGGGAENQRIDGTGREKVPASAGGKDLQRATDARFGRSREGSEQVVVHDFERHAQRDDRKGEAEGERQEEAGHEPSRKPLFTTAPVEVPLIEDTMLLLLLLLVVDEDLLPWKGEGNDRGSEGGRRMQASVKSAAPQPDHYPLLDALTR